MTLRDFLNTVPDNAELTVYDEALERKIYWKNVVYCNEDYCSGNDVGGIVFGTAETLEKETDKYNKNVYYEDYVWAGALKKAFLPEHSKEVVEVFVEGDHVYYITVK